MRIGYDAKRAFHNFRGLGNYSRNLIESVSKLDANCNIHLYTPQFTDPRAKDWATKNLSFKIHTPSSSFMRTVPSLWRSLGLKKEIQKDKLDIYHGLSHELTFGIDGLAVKKILTVHDLLFLRKPKYFNYIDRKVYGRKLKYALNSSDLIVSVCEQTKKDLIEFYNIEEKKIKVVYQTCDQQFYKPFSKEKLEDISNTYKLPEKFILYVGALEENKNVINLVRAFKKVTETEKDLFLVIVGEGKEYKARLKKEIQMLGLGEKVVFPPYVLYSDLPGVYQQAEVFCFPSFFEGFGIPIIESLFSKTPVVTTKGFCFPEAGGPSSEYIDPHDPIEIANSLKKIVSNPSLKEDMAAMGQEYAQKFHWKNLGENIIDLYKEITT